MNKLGGLLLGASLFALNPVQAEVFDFSTEKPNVFRYTYIEGGYIDRDGDFDGFGVAGSFDIKPNLSIIGSFSTTSADAFGVSVDFNAFSIGAAHHYKFENQTLPNSDISLHAEFVRYDFDVATIFGTASSSDSGFRIGATGRHRIQPNLEINGDISFETTDVNDISITPGFAFDLQENISIVGSYEISDADVLMIGARMYF